MTVDLLAFGPHPDDVEIFCGGILLRARDFGHSVGVVDLTRGERGSHGSAEERAKESEAASEILGLSFRDNLGLPDAGLDATSDAQATAIVDVLRRRRPEIVLVPWSAERHPDHVAASALITRALFLAGLRKFDSPEGGRFVPQQVLHYAQRHRMTPSFVVDTSAAWGRKLQAIRCYASQVGRQEGEDETLISSGGALAAIDARDRWHGSMIGTAHGEPLRCVAIPGLADPVRHFRDNPFTGAHAFEPLA
jgi:bacillithiol biosynthesis deacetylase BshB1